MKMKVFVCCLFVIANISNNGKASLDSAVSYTTNILEDTIKNSEKCYRPCKFNVKPKRCQYKFNIAPSVGDDGSWIAINGMSPGPSIHACANDVIVVEVTNKIPGQSIAIHWHGVEQKGTPFMDGVPMVTQCPIEYGTTYKYTFVASSPGTFFYHADSVAHQSDGVYGSLVVNQPQPLEPYNSLYDFDRSNENSLLIAAKFPEPMTGNLEDTSRIQPNALVINGDKETAKLFVLPGYAYRLRLINAVAIECPVVVNIDKHDLMIIATDAKHVKKMLTRNVQLYPVLEVYLRDSSYLRFNYIQLCLRVYYNIIMLKCM